MPLSKLTLAAVDKGNAALWNTSIEKNLFLFDRIFESSGQGLIQLTTNIQRVENAAACAAPSLYLRFRLMSFVTHCATINQHPLASAHANVGQKDDGDFLHLLSISCSTTLGQRRRGNEEFIFTFHLLWNKLARCPPKIQAAMLREIGGRIQGNIVMQYSLRCKNILFCIGIFFFVSVFPCVWQRSYSFAKTGISHRNTSTRTREVNLICLSWTQYIRASIHEQYSY